MTEDEDQAGSKDPADALAVELEDVEISEKKMMGKKGKAVGEDDAEVLSFDNVVSDLAPKVPNNITVPFYFICVLHLANEKVRVGCVDVVAGWDDASAACCWVEPCHDMFFKRFAPPEKKKTNAASLR